MKPLTYSQWFKKYAAAFADEVNIDARTAAGTINEDLAKRDYNKGYDPHKAGRDAARFAFFGE